MIPSSAAGLAWSSPVMSLGLDLAARATAILAVAILIALALHRRASLASAVGNAAVLGLLLLPFSTLALPAVSITCLPGGSRTSAPGTAPQPVPHFPDLQDGADRLDEVVRREPVLPAMEVPAPSPNAGTTPASSGGVPALTARAIVADGVQAATPPNRRIDWATAIIASYLGAATVLLLRLVGSLLAVARLRRSCRAVCDRGWVDGLARQRAKLGIGREVMLASSPRVGVPLVLGWFRPTIVLPELAAAPESHEHVDAVLLHELSHVRRGDYLWNVLLRVAQALYWPHPLAWALGRVTAEMRERACDDLCVHEMGGPAAYRETLLAMAAGLARRPFPSLGLAMARASRLGRRLARIGHTPGAERCRPPWPARLAIAATAVAISVGLGTLRLARAEARAEAGDAPPRIATEPAAAPGGRVFHLQVFAADTGEPVADADVRVWIALRDEWRKTDDRGRLEIRHSTGAADRSFGVDVWGRGRAMQRHNWGQVPSKPVPDGETIRLQQGETLGGLVRDEEGRPIAGATVYLWSHNYKKKDPHELLYDLRATSGADGSWTTSGAPETTGELLGFHVVHPDFLSSRDYTHKEIIPKIADLRTGKAVTVLKKGVPIEGRVLDADGKPVAGARVVSTDRQGALSSQVDEFAVATDADGRFRTGQVGPGEWFLLAQAKGHSPGERRVKLGTAVPQVEITLGRPHPFRGRVVGPDGKPIAGAFVNPDTWRGYRCLGAFLWTDDDGRFRWDDAPDDPLRVNVSRQGYLGLFMQDVNPAVEDVVFTLRPSLSIGGTVRDAETKKRVNKATVEFGPVDPETGEVAKWTGTPELGFATGVYQGDLQLNIPVAADSYKFRVRSPGYKTFVSRAFRRDETAIVGYDIMLLPGQDDGRPAGAVGTVLLPDGSPLVGASVHSTRLNQGLNVADGAVRDGRDNGREDRTRLDGTFPLPTDEGAWIVLVLGEGHYAIASKEMLETSREIRAKPYARVEGRYLIGDRPVPNREVELIGLLQSRLTMYCTIFAGGKATTDADGRFTFEKVIPIPGLRVTRRDRADGPGRVWALGEPVNAEPGETAKVTLGGKGRPLVGRVEPPVGWGDPVDFTDRSEAYLESNRPWTPYPPRLFRGKTTLEGRYWSDWTDQWRESPEGRAYADRRVAVRVGLAPDGSFRIDDVPPGEYRLSVGVNRGSRGRDPGPFAREVRVVRIPPAPGGRSDKPLDVGAVRLRPRKSLKVGEPAPSFEVITSEGQKVAIPGDFRGRYLLLDFSTLWDMQSPLQIARLNDVRRTFGEDPRFAMLTLMLAADDAETRAYIADKGEPWPQAIVGPLSNPAASGYDVDDESVPAAILIGPDGRIIAKDLHYKQIAEAVGEALRRAGK